MNIKYLVGKTCQKVYDKIKSKEFVSCFRMRSKDFTRNRKAGLSDNMMMVLNKTGRGIRAAVRAFIKVTQEEGSTYSQQAFSKGRMRIKWEAFKDIFSVTVNDCYSEYDYQTFSGYRLLAVDGSRLNLPYHPDSMDEFGVQKSSGGQIQALASCLYDVLNGVVVDAIIAPCNASERDLAVEHLENLQTIKEPDLVLFDRGYPSANMIDKLEKGGFQYLMRCDDSFTSGMKKYFSGNDCVITYRFKKDKTEKTFRVVRFDINGTQEILITNLFDGNFTIEEFKRLYHLRWGIETKYDDIKNKLELENFSGTTPLAIKQDFYATLFLSNLVSLMILENREEIEKRNKSRNNKYQYKMNVNAVISELKENVILLLITDSNRKKKKLLQDIYFAITNAVIPIRPGRSFERKKKHYSVKYHQNDKA